MCANFVHKGKEWDMEHKSATLTAGSLMVEQSEMMIPELMNGGKNGEMHHNGKTPYQRLKNITPAGRKVREIRSRYQQLDDGFWDFFLNGASDAEKAIILFLASFRLHEVLQELHLEVMLEKWRNEDYRLRKRDVRYFLENKSYENYEVDNLPERKFQRLNTVLLNIYRESGLIDHRGYIQKPELSEKFWDLVRANEMNWVPEILCYSLEEKAALLK